VQCTKEGAMHFSDRRLDYNVNAGKDEECRAIAFSKKMKYV
jgi:hypothetical protein